MSILLVLVLFLLQTVISIVGICSGVSFTDGDQLMQYGSKLLPAMNTNKVTPPADSGLKQVRETLMDFFYSSEIKFL